MSDKPCHREDTEVTTLQHGLGISSVCVCIVSSSETFSIWPLGFSIQCVFYETDPMRQIFKWIMEHFFKLLIPRALACLGPLPMSVQIHGRLHLTVKMAFWSPLSQNKSDMFLSVLENYSCLWIDCNLLMRSERVDHHHQTWGERARVNIFLLRYVFKLCSIKGNCKSNWCTTAVPWCTVTSRDILGSTWEKVVTMYISHNDWKIPAVVGRMMPPPKIATSESLEPANMWKLHGKGKLRLLVSWP